MQGRFADEFAVGDRFTSHARTITEADVVAFTSLTGIAGPTFTDDTFARSTALGSRLVPGPLVLAYALGLTSELVYGTVLAALGIDEVRFLAPTHHGNTVWVRTEVTAHRPSRSRPGTAIVVLGHEVFIDGLESPSCTFSRTMLSGTRAYMEDLRGPELQRVQDSRDGA